MTRRKLRPEIEFPQLMIEAMREYIGVRRMGNLSREQLQQIAELSTETGTRLADIITPKS